MNRLFKHNVVTLSVRLALKHWLKQNLISLDQQLNSLCFGWADETLSSRCYRLSRDGITHATRALIDALFFWEYDHCKKSYISERDRLQLPPEFRSVPDTTTDTTTATKADK